MILSFDEFAVELTKLRDLLDDQTYTDREMRSQVVGHVDDLLRDMRETAEAERATRPAETTTRGGVVRAGSAVTTLPSAR